MGVSVEGRAVGPGWKEYPYISAVRRRSSARSQVTRRLRPRSGKEAVQMERIIRRISRAGERVLLSFFVASIACA